MHKDELGPKAGFVVLKEKKLPHWKQPFYEVSLREIVSSDDQFLRISHLHSSTRHRNSDRYQVFRGGR